MQLHEIFCCMLLGKLMQGGKTKYFFFFEVNCFFGKLLILIYIFIFPYTSVNNKKLQIYFFRKLSYKFHEKVRTHTVTDMV